MGKKIDWALVISIINLLLIASLGVTFGIIEKNQREKIISLEGKQTEIAEAQMKMEEEKTEFNKLVRMYEEYKKILDHQNKTINNPEINFTELNCVNESIFLQNQRVLSNATIFLFQKNDYNSTKNLFQQLDLRTCYITAETEGEGEVERCLTWLWILIAVIVLILIIIGYNTKKKK